MYGVYFVLVVTILVLFPSKTCFDCTANAMCEKIHICIYVYDVYMSIMCLDAYVYIYSSIRRSSMIFVTLCFPVELCSIMEKL